ncbi:LysR family glycine cleavage system transcriptional activator [Sphingomonas sp. UYAg733]
MARQLPPLSALRAFEAAARHGSFKRAAEELSVTPTAISHQIRSLEEYIGLTLFERRTREVVLTGIGAEIYPVLRDGFDAFATVFDRLTQRRSRPQVTISATIAFTARWLVPRVALFQRKHPDIDLHLQASDEAIDLSRTAVDLAIRYGQGPYPGVAAEELFADVFAPVVNPMLQVISPADLQTVPMIEFEWRRHHPVNPTWERWFSAAGLDATPTPARLCFSDESHAIQSAVAGQGIALTSLILVADEIAAGRLVQPFGPLLPGHRHHLLMLKERPSPAVVAVAEWLRSETRAATCTSD